MESLYLTVPGAGGARGQQGTAWLLWPDLVATALHVVGREGAAGLWAHDDRGDAAYRLRLPWRKPGADVVTLEPAIYDPRADVALLRLPESARADIPDGAFAVLADGLPGVGDPWRAVGFPGFVAGARAIAVGGVVSHVGAGITSTTIQLFVDQDTSAQWAGISGSAVQNAWGEVTGVMLQTMERIATCNAAPAEAVARLVRLESQRKRIAAALEQRLGALPPGALEEVANALQWGWLPNRADFQAAKVPVLAARIAQAGEEGVRQALEALRALAPKPADAGAGVAATPTVEEDALAVFMAEAAVKRPTEADLVAVLDALADAGGALRPASELRARLPALPAEIFEAALDALHDSRDIDGMRGLDVEIVLSPAGATRAIRLDYARAALRPLLPGDAVPLPDLEAQVPIAPRALRRTLAHAEAMRLVTTPDRRRYLITDAGRALLAKRTVDPTGERGDPPPGPPA